MSGIIGAMNTALSGIEAFESGINTVSNNLANVTTSGYSAESVDFMDQVDLSNGSGFGVQSPAVIRAAGSFASGVMRTATTANQAASTLATNLAGISSALLNNGDIQTSMNQFFQDVGTLAANPSSAGARETVLSDAQTVAGTFQTASTSLETTMTDAGTALQENVSTANNLLSQLATINQGLQTSPDNPSLLDQQASALSSLSSLLPVNVLTQSNGSVQLSLGSNVLLNQAGAQTLSLSGGSATQPPQIKVGDQPMSLSLSDSDGEMGANMATWQAGSQALQGLNTIATVFTSEVNTAQAEGLTYNGTQGNNLFAPAPKPSVTAATTNTGTAPTLSATLTNPAALPADGGPFTLTYSNSGTGPGTWTYTDQATGVSSAVTPTPQPTATSPTVLAFAGMNVTVSGTPANGDSYTINPAPGAAAGMSVVATNPDDIAAADPYVGTPGTMSATGAITDTNAGKITTGTDSVTTTPPPPNPSGSPSSYVPASDYGDPLTVVFTGTAGSPPTGYSIYVGTTSSTSLGTEVASGLLTNNGGALSGTISVQYPTTANTSLATNTNASGEYWQLPISGTPAVGDTLTLQPGGPTSGSNATRMAAVWTSPSTATVGSSASTTTTGSTTSTAGITGGNSTLQQAVIGFTTGLGANANEAMTLATGTATQVSSATTNLENIAGVNSDQQAVLLVNYEQAYQAAAQVISTAHTMFQSLLSSVAA